jgi:DeoR family transcriptional regulator of aga operon
VTVRSDLDTLEAKSLVRRVHGGAMSNRRATERPFDEVAGELAAQKAAIGRAAAALVQPGDHVFVDVGTTTAALTAALVERTDLDDVTVFTNGINVALALEAATPRITVVVTGGTLRPKQHSLVNPMATAMLQGLRVSTAFLGCNGVDAVSGITNINLPEAEVKRAIAAAADRRVVVADSSKLGVTTLALVVAIDDVDVLVTDADADPTQVEALRSSGIDVVVAG